MAFTDRTVRTRLSDDQFRPILEIAEELGIEAEPSGTYWWGAVCPVHDDNDPSLRFNEPGNFFYCFGCSKGGNAAQFYQFVNPGVSWDEAVAATVRKDADALDDLSGSLDEARDNRQQTDAVVAIQLVLVERTRDLEDDTTDPQEWARVLCEAPDEELLTKLRAIL